MRHLDSSLVLKLLIGIQKLRNLLFMCSFNACKAVGRQVNNSCRDLYQRMVAKN
jgi:hypothetical protein